MGEGKFRHFSASGSALDESFLDEEGFVDLFDSAGVLSERRGDGG